MHHRSAARRDSKHSRAWYRLIPVRFYSYTETPIDYLIATDLLSVARYLIHMSLRLRTSIFNFTVENQFEKFMAAQTLPHLDQWR